MPMATDPTRSPSAAPLDRLRALGANLAALGPRRLALLGAAFALVLGAVLAGSMMLGAPTYETIYANLERRDAAAIGRELSAVGIPHSTGEGGTSVAVPLSRVGEARTHLASRGLPESEGGGYELFDQIGSLGLTSFMQEVTRLRALEGEIARTIRAIEGVAAARVHLVMPDPGSFRRESREPTASIVITARSEAARASAPAIRHLVAAAVPGLAVAGVTVLDDRGQLLIAGDTMETTGLASSLQLVATMEREVEAKVGRALEPFLGRDAFRVSAKARLNTDREEVRETTFDPDGRVEREVRIEREQRRSDRRDADAAVTVENDLPDTGDAGAASGDATSESDDRRTETTSYEINQRTVSRVRDAHRLERLTVAVVVDRARVEELAGGTDDAAIAETVERVRSLALSAAGMDEERGDVAEIAAVAFAPSEAIGGGEASATLALARHAGTAVAALAFVAGLAVLAWGLRPAVRQLLADPSGRGADEWGAPPDEDGFARLIGDGAPDAVPRSSLAGPPLSGVDASEPLEDPADRLARLVDLDERRTAMVLRRWINEAANHSANQATNDALDQIAQEARTA